VTTPLPENPSTSIPVDVDWSFRSSQQHPLHACSPYRPFPKDAVSSACILFLADLLHLPRRRHSVRYRLFPESGLLLRRVFSASYHSFLQAASRPRRRPAILLSLLLPFFLTHETRPISLPAAYHHIRADLSLLRSLPPTPLARSGAFIFDSFGLSSPTGLCLMSALQAARRFRLRRSCARLRASSMAKLVPGLANPANAEVIYGHARSCCVLLDALLHPGISPERASHARRLAAPAWVGLFVTSLNLVPVLPNWTGGHILRSIRRPPCTAYIVVLFLPIGIILLGPRWFFLGWAGTSGAASFFSSCASSASPPFYEPPLLSIPPRSGAPALFRSSHLSPFFHARAFSTFHRVLIGPVQISGYDSTRLPRALGRGGRPIFPVCGYKWDPFVPGFYRNCYFGNE